MGNQQSSTSSSRRKSGSASKGSGKKSSSSSSNNNNNSDDSGTAKRVVNDMQSGLRQTMRKLEDSTLLEQMCGPFFDDEKFREQRSTSYAYSEDLSEEEEEEEDSRTVSEDDTFDDHYATKGTTDRRQPRTRGRSATAAKNKNAPGTPTGGLVTTNNKKGDSGSLLSQQSDYTDPKDKSKHSFETSEDESYHHHHPDQNHKNSNININNNGIVADVLVTDSTSDAGPTQLAKPLASSFAKRCYFTKAGIGKTTQHYEGLTLTGNVVLMLASAMKLKGCPTICDEDLRRVEQTYPNQFSRLPDELLLSSGWRRISKYCHFSNKPIPDGVPFFHSKRRSHPSGGYYFLLATAVGMIRPLDVEPLTRDTLVLLETDFPTQCDAAPSILIQDPTEWTLVDKFCFFSGGPINSEEDVFYQADFDGNSIFMLAFLSPSLTPEELYKLAMDVSDGPGIKSVREVEEVECVYDLTERDFEDLKLYHLGPCRALPPYVIHPQAWTKVLPPHFMAAKQRAILRAQRWEEKYGLAPMPAMITEVASVAPPQPTSVAGSTNAIVPNDQNSVTAPSDPMIQQQQQQPSYQYDQAPYFSQQPEQWQGHQGYTPGGQPQQVMPTTPQQQQQQQSTMLGPSVPSHPLSHGSSQKANVNHSGYYPQQYPQFNSTHNVSPNIHNQGTLGGTANGYTSPHVQGGYYETSTMKPMDPNAATNQDFQRQVEEEGAFDNSAPLDEAIAQRNRSQKAQPPGWRPDQPTTGASPKLDPPDDQPPSLSKHDRYRITDVYDNEHGHGRYNDPDPDPSTHTHSDPPLSSSQYDPQQQQQQQPPAYEPPPASQVSSAHDHGEAGPYNVPLQKMPYDQTSSAAGPPPSTYDPHASTIPYDQASSAAGPPPSLYNPQSSIGPFEPASPAPYEQQQQQQQQLQQQQQHPPAQAPPSPAVPPYDQAVPGLYERRAPYVQPSPASYDQHDPSPYDPSAPAPYSQQDPPAPYDPNAPAPYDPGAPATFDHNAPAPYDPSAPATYDHNAPPPYDHNAPAPYDHNAPPPYDQQGSYNDTAPQQYDQNSTIPYDQASQGPYDKGAAPYDHPSQPPYDRAYDHPSMYDQQPRYGSEPSYGPQEPYEGEPYDGDRQYDGQSYDDRQYDQPYDQPYNGEASSQYYDRRERDGNYTVGETYMGEGSQPYSPDDGHPQYEESSYLSPDKETKEDYLREGEYYSSPEAAQKGSYQTRGEGYYDDTYSQSRDGQSYISRDDPSYPGPVNDQDYPTPRSQRGSGYDQPASNNRSPRKRSDNNSAYSYDRSRVDDRSGYGSRGLSNDYSPRKGHSYHNRSKADDYTDYGARGDEYSTYTSRADQRSYDSRADRSDFESRVGERREFRGESYLSSPEKSDTYRGSPTGYSDHFEKASPDDSKNYTRSHDDHESPTKLSVVGSEYTAGSSMARSAQDLLKRNRQNRQKRHSEREKSQKKTKEPLSPNSNVSPRSDHSESTWESASERTSVISGSSVWTDGSTGGDRSTRRALILQMAKARMKSSGGKSTCGATVHSEDKTNAPIEEEPDNLEAPDFSGELD